MKHIDLKKVAQKDGQVTFCIANQTHRGAKFGHKGSYCFGGGRSDSVMLRSAEGPGIFIEDKPGVSVVLLVRGADTTKDNDGVTTSVEIYAKLEEAVKEYNKDFGPKGMKLGTDTGSIINWLSVQPGYHKPEVGQDVTECMWTDRQAWRVTAVTPDGKGATLTRYAPKWVGKAYGDESYEYVDKDGKPLLHAEHTMEIRYRYRAWRVGADGKGGKIHLSWCRREEYRDPSF